MRSIIVDFPVYHPIITASVGDVNKELWATCHKGTDFAGREGHEIKSVLDGTVQLCGWHGKLGLRVWILSDDIRCLYAHLSGILADKVGQVVKRGEVIGLMGSTGNSTNPHLHFGIEDQHRNIIRPIFKGGL